MKGARELLRTGDRGGDDADEGAVAAMETDGVGDQPELVGVLVRDHTAASLIPIQHDLTIEVLLHDHLVGGERLVRRAAGGGGGGPGGRFGSPAARSGRVERGA